jgi:hypothetical protein
MTTQTIPDILHICPLCKVEMAFGTYDSGVPRACAHCDYKAVIARMAREKNVDLYQAMNAEARARAFGSRDRRAYRASSMRFAVGGVLTAALAAIVILWWALQ